MPQHFDSRGSQITHLAVLSAIVGYESNCVVSQNPQSLRVLRVAGLRVVLRAVEPSAALHEAIPNRTAAIDLGWCWFSGRRRVIRLMVYCCWLVNEALLMNQRA